MAKLSGYDEHLGLQAMSQTIDPLLCAYRDARFVKGQACETEAEIQRLVTWRRVDGDFFFGR
jgi:hypothetical protein